ncbi:MAG: hypothetical protein GY898_27945 [Proteobacteria bacterium]|nr:hypothetical protein [Pseudomonadota bacterium]
MDHSKMEHVMTPDGVLVMIMQGMPGWLFGSAVAAVILVSFLLVEWRGLDAPGTARIELAGRRRGLRWASSGRSQGPSASASWRASPSAWRSSVWRRSGPTR